MNALGVSLIVGGMALLFSGLIFLLPIEGKVAGKRRSFEESQKEIEYYLGQMQREGRRLGRNAQAE
jgi:hypothetical protein